MEKDARRFRQLKANIRTFRCPNIRPLLGAAPVICKGLPRPDRVFIGGSGGALEAILNTVRRKLNRGGIAVANCVTMDSLETVLGRFKKWGWGYDVSLVSISRLGSDRRPEVFRAENPVDIVQGKPASGS